MGDPSASSPVISSPGKWPRSHWTVSYTHLDVYKRQLQEYPGDRMLVVEAWVGPAPRLARYVRPDEAQQAFNFDFLISGWHRNRMRDTIDISLRANYEVGAPCTWVLSNHDTVRHASRYGLGSRTAYPLSLIHI